MSALARSTRSRHLLALLAAGALLLGACGSDSDDSTTTTTTEARSTTAGGDSSTSSEVDGPDTTDDTTSDTTSDTTTDTIDPTDTTPGGSVPEDASEAVAGISSALASSLEIEDSSIAQCVAEDWVDTVGFERIQAAGAGAEGLGTGDSEVWALLDISQDEADDLYDAIGECGHDVGPIMRSSFSEGADAACVERILNDDAVAEFVTQTFLGAQSSDALNQLAECTSTDG